MSFFLGIDSGTSSVKTALVESEKGILDIASQECLPVYANGFVEIEMNVYWEAVKSCIGELRSRNPEKIKSISAISVSSQGVTFTTVDSKGNDLGNAVVAYDERAKDEAEQIISLFGAQKIFDRTGQPVVSETYEASKLLWVRRREPEKFRAIDKILLVHDYLIYKLTGRFITVPSILSSSLLFDVRKRVWWDEMLDFIGLSPKQLPEISDAGEPVGNISPEVSSETGIPQSALIVAGAIDQLCGMIGIGNIRPGILSESTGSFLAVHTVTTDFFDKKEAGIHNFCGFQKKDFVLIGICPTAGSAFEWIKKIFFDCGGNTPGTYTFENICEKAGAVPPGAEGLLMLSHLAGKGSPSPNPPVKGMFYGFGLGHRQEHFARACMESVAYMLRNNLDVLRDNGLSISKIYSFGGGARSDLWNGIKADVCGLAIESSGGSEPGCLGAAIIAGTGSGIYNSIADGCSALVKRGKIYYPDNENSKKYKKSYENYLKLNKLIDKLYMINE
ncbi:MAG: FGGY family carbohydrate kinase [Candidatus Latescibacterota bacterium]